jgi:hypothetical protein
LFPCRIESCEKAKALRGFFVYRAAHEGFEVFYMTRPEFLIASLCACEARTIPIARQRLFRIKLIAHGRVFESPPLEISVTHDVKEGMQRRTTNRREFQIDVGLKALADDGRLRLEPDISGDVFHASTTKFLKNSLN